VPAHRAAAQPVAAEPQLVQRAALAQQVPVRRAERRRDVEAVLQAGLRLELLSAGWRSRRRRTSRRAWALHSNTRQDDRRHGHSNRQAAVIHGTAAAGQELLTALSQ